MSTETLAIISAGGVSLWIETGGVGAPRLGHFGPSEAQSPPMPSPPLPSSPDVRARNRLLPLAGAGFFGEPALVADGPKGPVFDFAITEIDACGAAASLALEDGVQGARLRLSYRLTEDGVLCARARIENHGDGELRLARLNALTLPAPRWANVLDLTYGSWGAEGHRTRHILEAGKLERSGRSGRPGFDGGPHLLVTERCANERTGRAIGLALAHSGDFILAAERFGDGDGQFLLAERLDPSEVALAPGDAYETPWAYAAISVEGIGGLSRRFHALARRLAPPTRMSRPTQLNTWEAAYFNVDEQTAFRLADAAAELGLERFVLDDGWFRGRNNDAAALGDWTPDPIKFPRGLEPLAERVGALGMEFGLWVEPEMANPDSDLLRAHPDWILTRDGTLGPTGRKQLVLNLGHEAVRDHLFLAIDRLLRDQPIGYLKWDCNRDLFPATDHGRPATRRQIEGLYDLLGRIRAAHPAVSIESCASGGGRIDFGVLRFTDRFWTSDATDALERVRIQRRASVFLPPELLGVHVGPGINPWTRRRLPMTFRCLTALFGHFGAELDPATLDIAEAATLKRAVALYKRFRPLICDGALMRHEDGEVELDVQSIHAAHGTEALVRVLRIAEPARPSLPPVCLSGLPEGRWRVHELHIEGASPASLMFETTSAALAFGGAPFSPSHVAEGRLFHLERLA